MLYAILAYHVEAEVMSWTAAEDAALMADLNKIHDRLTHQKQLGPAARLDATAKAHTLRGPGVVLDCANETAAIEAAHELHRVNPGAVYEIRPISLYLPGTAIPMTNNGRSG